MNIWIHFLRNREGGCRRWLVAGGAALILILALVFLTPRPLRQSDLATQQANWPTGGWQSVTPEDQGMDGAALNRMDEYNRQQLPDLYSVLVVRHGYLVFEKYYHGYYPDIPFEVASVTKSVTSALVGIALEKGYLKSLDQPVIEFFPEYPVSDLDPLAPTLTLRHLLSMTSGFDWSEEKTWYWPHYASWMRYALSMRIAHPPGTQFGYNTPAAHLLSGVLTQATHQSLSAFAQQELFTPLGIASPEWGHDPEGYTTGAHALHLTARDMAKFGYLYLKQGRWDGKQLVPAAWVDLTTRQHTEGGFPQGTAYGYLWWVTNENGHAAYFAAGYGGQYIEVVPDLELVVVMTAATDQPHLQHRALIRNYIVPAVR